eukprot:gene7260-14806_t
MSGKSDSGFWGKVYLTIYKNCEENRYEGVFSQGYEPTSNAPGRVLHREQGREGLVISKHVEGGTSKMDGKGILRSILVVVRCLHRSFGQEYSADGIIRGISVEFKRTLGIRVSATTNTALLKIFFILCYFFGGALIYHELEGWNPLECCYFTTLTLFTVGYGDITPSSQGSKLFTIFFIISGLIFVLNNVVNAAQSVLEYAEQQAENIKLHPILQETSLRHFRKQMVFSWIVIVCLLISGTVFMMFNEGLSLVDALYWAVQTSSELDAEGRGVDEATFLCNVLSRLHNLDLKKDLEPWRE